MMNDLKRVMDETFRFRVGDLVAPLALLEGLKLDLDVNGKIDYGRTSLFCPVVIVERIIQECPGGVQLYYTVSGTAAAGAVGAPVRCLAHEVVAWSDVTAIVRDLSKPRPAPKLP